VPAGFVAPYYILNPEVDKYTAAGQAADRRESGDGSVCRLLSACSAAEQVANAAQHAPEQTGLFRQFFCLSICFGRGEWADNSFCSDLYPWFTCHCSRLDTVWVCGVRLHRLVRVDWCRGHKGLFLPIICRVNGEYSPSFGYSGRGTGRR
jgi:hypothetical protein